MLTSIVFGLFFGGLLDSSMTLYLNSRYGLDSEGAGLVFIAAVVPAFIGSPLSGWMADKVGTRLTGVLSLATIIPFICLLTIPQLPLAAFVVILVFVGCIGAAILVPVMADQAKVVEATPGLDYVSLNFALFAIETYLEIGACIWCRQPGFLHWMCALHNIIVLLPLTIV